MGQSKKQTYHGKLGGMLTLIYIDLYVKYLFFSQLHKTEQERKIYFKNAEMMN